MAQYIFKKLPYCKICKYLKLYYYYYCHYLESQRIIVIINIIVKTEISLIILYNIINTG